MTSDAVTGPTPRQGLAIVGASLVGAVAGFAVLAIVTRSVSLEQSAVFVTFWSALLVTYGALTGVNTETARSVAGAATGRAAGSAQVSTVLRVVPAFVLVVAALGSIAAWVWGSDVVTTLALVVGLSATAYAVEAILLGALSGRGSWNAYAGLLTCEAALRILLVSVVALLGAAVVGIAWAAGAAALVWVLALVLSARTRQAAIADLDVPLPGFLRRAGTAALTAGISGVLLVGFPVMVAVTTTPQVFATAAPLMVAITLTRAPIMVPLTAFQSVLVSQLVRAGAGAGAAIVRLVALLGLVALVGAVAAYLLGPWLMVLLFGADYRIGGGVLAAMTFASVATAVITLTGAFAQATGRHGTFLAGWSLALAVTVVALLMPWSLQVRVLVALLAGPMAGAALHVTSMIAARRRRARVAGPMR